MTRRPREQHWLWFLGGNGFSFPVLYVEEGRQHFASSMLSYFVMQFKQQFEKCHWLASHILKEACDRLIAVLSEI